MCLLWDKDWFFFFCLFFFSFKVIKVYSCWHENLLDVLFGEMYFSLSTIWYEVFRLLTLVIGHLGFSFPLTSFWLRLIFPTFEVFIFFFYLRWRFYHLPQSLHWLGILVEVYPPWEPWWICIFFLWLWGQEIYLSW